MAGQGKFMAYVGSYSYNGNAKGITVFDVDVEKGVFYKRTEVEVDNSSYVAVSADKKTLYSIADEGIVSFRIHPDGNLSRLNSTKINGLRGCHIATDIDDHYIFVSGYHDGKASVLRLLPDGSVGEVVASIYHKGLGSVAERNFRPHVTCCRRTPDKKYLVIVDSGLDQIKVYRFSEADEHLVQVDTVPCDLESGPKSLRFTSDGKFCYVMYDQKNCMEVFTYETGDRVPVFERIQTISTIGDRPNPAAAACAFRFSRGQKYLFVSNAGAETVAIFERDPETGLLKLLRALPISGTYPKDIGVFPGNKHIASINHSSNSITFFEVDYEKGLLIMCARELKINEPNSCVFVRLPDEA